MKQIFASVKNRFDLITGDDRFAYVATPLIVVGSVIAASYIASKLPDNEEDE